MSGLPNDRDVAELHTALAAIAEENAIIVRAMADKSKAERFMEGAQERQAEAKAKVEKLMAAMDCAEPGNTGYHGRLFALLYRLDQHAEQYGREHP